MLAAIKKEIGTEVTQDTMETFFKDLFPIGNPSKIVDILMKSLSDKSPEGLYELILSCKNSKIYFAKWIYKCILITNEESRLSTTGI
ncbi:hypothetical protein NEAUS03_2536, partial [Nematocida ausubeli]